jgi:alpha-galactosidase
MSPENDMNGKEPQHQRRVRYKGTHPKNFKEKYKELNPEKYADTGFVTKPEDVGDTDVFTCANLVGFDLFKRYSVIPASSDRHIAEFFPPWYLKDPETVRKWKFHLTPVSLRIQEDIEMEARRKRILEGKEKFMLSHSGEEGTQQMKALLGLGDFVTNMNIPNAGQLSGLPLGCIVETNALMSKDSIKPIFAGQLPDDLQSLLVRHVTNQEMILRAGLDQDKEMAFRAFINDPLMTIGLQDARALFDEMLRNTAKYLPGWDV